MRSNSSDMLFLRHLVAVGVLPFTATVLVPAWIARRFNVATPPGNSAGELLVQLFGIVLAGTGAVLFFTSLHGFVSEGRGTLAPWDPPRQLVVSGPYQFVRNPMISGVVFVLFGEACVLLSRPHATWAALFLLVNLIYIPLFEERQLAARFGESYRVYCRHVPRIVPRSSPWRPGRTMDRAAKLSG